MNTKIRTVVLGSAMALSASLAWAQSHGIAMYGEPALPPDFVSLPYANPDAPKISAVRELRDARASAVQFRYLWVTDADGVKLFDITSLRAPVAVPEGTVPLADAQQLIQHKGRASATLLALDGTHEGFADPAQAGRSVLDFLRQALRAAPG